MSGIEPPAAPAPPPAPLPPVMPVTAPKQGHWKKAGIRGVAAGICLVLAAVLMPLGVVAFWGQRTLTDTSRFVQTFEPLSTDPVVREAIATTVADSITAAVDVPDIVKEWLPPQAAPLAGPMASVVDKFVYEATSKFLASEQFHKLWITINTKLQQAVIAALSGNSSGAVSIQGNEIVLDLGQVTQKVQEALVAKGLTALADKPIPDAANQQIVLLNSSQLGQAQTIYKLTKPAATWLIFMVFLLFAVAIAVAKRRARMAVWVGLLMIVICGLFRLVISLGDGPAADSFAGTPFAGAGAIFYGTLTHYLRQAFDMMILVGIVIAIVGWLCSKNAAAVQLREVFKKGPPPTPPGPPAPPIAS